MTTHSSYTQADASRARRKRLFRDTRRAWLYIAPAGLLMIIITLLPQLFQWWMSLTDFEITNLRYNPLIPGSAEFRPEYSYYEGTVFGYDVSHIPGIGNFVRILKSELAIQDYYFPRLLFFNVWWTVSNVVLHTVIGVAIAMALNYKNLIGRKIYRALFIIPWAIPGMVSATVWTNMFHDRFGAVNQLIDLFNQAFFTSIPDTTRWLAQVDNEGILAWLPMSYFAALMTNVWLGWPFMTVVATGALQSIPNEMYEAADIDGATGWQKFKKITLPLLRPAMVPAIMLGTIWTFNQFNIIYFVTNGGPKGRTEILVTQAYKLIFTQRLYGIGAAFSIVVFFILLAFTLMQNRVTRATESYDA